MSRKSVVVFVALFVLLALLAACGTAGSESSADGGNTSLQNSGEASSTGSGSLASSSSPGAESSELEPIGEQDPTEFLEVKDSAYTDKDCFALVGVCENGAVITASTPGGQEVSVETDNGCFSVRIKKEGRVSTRVTLTAVGELTETYTLDVTPNKRQEDPVWYVVAGKGYHFFFNRMMQDFQHQNTISASQYNTVVERTKSRIESIRELSPDCELIIVMAPSESTIYPEYVPEEYPQGAGQSRLEQYADAFTEGGAIVIDLLSAFKEHKNDEQKLYWGTDSHWTDYGGFIAYTEIFDVVSERFPMAAPRPYDDFTWTNAYYDSGDMMNYMYMDQTKIFEYGVLREPAFDMPEEIGSVIRYRRNNQYLMYSDDTTYRYEFSNNNASMPNLIVMRDSYGAHVFDIWAERGNNVLYKAMWDFTFNSYEITEYQPDYIIMLVAEYNVGNNFNGM